MFGYIFGSQEYPDSEYTTQYYFYDGNESSVTYYIPTALKSVTVTSGDIFHGAFSGCSNLTNIELPNDITSIGEVAFADCHSLTSIVIPDSVTSIGTFAFVDCNSLSSVVLSNSITSLDSEIFSGCYSLTSITIPNGVTIISSGAFFYCTDLTCITFNGTVAEWNEIFKGYDWNYGVPATEVICSDGTVSLS